MDDDELLQRLAELDDTLKGRLITRLFAERGGGGTSLTNPSSAPRLRRAGLGSSEHAALDTSSDTG